MLATYIQNIPAQKAQAGKLGYSQSLYNLKDVANMLKSIKRHFHSLKKYIEQALFAAAKTYLKGVMNRHSSMMVKVWKAEYDKLTVEQIHKSVYSIFAAAWIELSF